MGVANINKPSFLFEVPVYPWRREYSRNCLLLKVICWNFIYFRVLFCYILHPQSCIRSAECSSQHEGPPRGKNSPTSKWNCGGFDIWNILTHVRHILKNHFEEKVTDCQSHWYRGEHKGNISKKIGWKWFSSLLAKRISLLDSHSVYFDILGRNHETDIRPEKILTALVSVLLLESSFMFLCLQCVQWWYVCAFLFRCTTLYRWSLPTVRRTMVSSCVKPSPD